jgi:acyl-CoA synthetase (AMP-forming)/AMP-acid ligase II
VFSDIIIRGGENLFPVQIENTITNHPSIREAAVIAVPDATYGETVGVWVVRHANEPPISRSELRQWVGKQMNPQVRPVVQADLMFRHFIRFLLNGRTSLCGYGL